MCKSFKVLLSRHHHHHRTHILKTMVNNDRSVFRASEYNVIGTLGNEQDAAVLNPQSPFEEMRTAILEYKEECRNERQRRKELQQQQQQQRGKKEKSFLTELREMIWCRFKWTVALLMVACFLYPIGSKIMQLVKMVEVRNNCTIDYSKSIDGIMDRTILTKPSLSECDQFILNKTGNVHDFGNNYYGAYDNLFALVDPDSESPYDSSTMFMDIKSNYNYNFNEDDVNILDWAIFSRSMHEEKYWINLDPMTKVVNHLVFTKLLRYRVYYIHNADKSIHFCLALLTLC